MTGCLILSKHFKASKDLQKNGRPAFVTRGAEGGGVKRANKEVLC